jgi:hypothetical protein
MRDFIDWMTPCVAAIGAPARRSLTLPPIAGYAPHPDRSYWLLVLGIAAIVYLALTLR